MFLSMMSTVVVENVLCRLILGVRSIEDVSLDPTISAMSSLLNPTIPVRPKFSIHDRSSPALSEGSRFWLGPVAAIGSRDFLRTFSISYSLFSTELEAGAGIIVPPDVCYAKEPGGLANENECN